MNIITKHNRVFFEKDSCIFYIRKDDLIKEDFIIFRECDGPAYSPCLWKNEILNYNHMLSLLSSSRFKYEFKYLNDYLQILEYIDKYKLLLE